MRDPLTRFGVPPIASYARSCSPVDSLDVVRHRRASEAARGDPSHISPSARKRSDMRGFRGLRLLGLKFLKRVKW